MERLQKRRDKAGNKVRKMVREDGWSTEECTSGGERMDVRGGTKLERGKGGPEGKSPSAIVVNEIDLMSRKTLKAC